MKKRVYIAGSIQGVENKQHYRKVLKKFLLSQGFDIYDPWEDEAIYYKDFDYKIACYLSTKDRKEVERSDILVAYLEQCSVGTTREIQWALDAGKRVIIISPMKKPSPHLVSCSKEYYHSLQEFIQQWSKTKGGNV